MPTDIFMKFAIVLMLCMDTTVAASTSETTGDTTRGPVVTTADLRCGFYPFSGSHGVISSPNFPDNYYNDLDCDYYVDSSSSSTLSFIFQSLHVESPDVVTFRCNYGTDFPPHEYSGHSLPEPVSMQDCNQGEINFRSDYTGVSNGFSVEYYVSSAVCGSTVYLGSNGYVNSPLWPDGYGFNQNCSNVIWAPLPSTIHLQFRSFNLQDNCSCDWLEISCLDNSEYGPTRYCGNNNNYEMHIYECSQVLLWFHSDSSSNYAGFFIEYTVFQEGDCGTTSYTDPSGVISSPNYPGDYYNFLNCDNIIYAPPGSSMTLVFSSFHVQETSDFVTITCASNSTYPEYQITGDYLIPPSPLSISDCSQGSVRFQTDDSIVSSGFSLEYYVNVGGCGNALYSSSSANVTSPNWPSNYGYDQNCSNIIYSVDRRNFYFRFHAFILQSCCDCDWLEISCLDNSDYGPTRYCGQIELPFDTYIYNCSRVLLLFQSDSSINDLGFNIGYSVFTNSDGGKVSSNGKPTAKKHVGK